LHDKILKKVNIIRPFILYDKESITFDDILNGRIRYLRGYWQYPDFFVDRRNELLKTFAFVKKDLDYRTKKIINEIKNNKSVSIHIRRGDYLWSRNVEQRGGICTKMYYENAVRHIEDKLGDCKFYVFTDDPNWAKSEFCEKKYKIIDWNIGEKSYIDMYLMSLCKHNIIANSSFSWWGAWLNENPDKIVVCPTKWYNKGESKLMLDEWIKME